MRQIPTVLQKKQRVQVVLIVLIVLIVLAAYPHVTQHISNKPFQSYIAQTIFATPYPFLELYESALFHCKLLPDMYLFYFTL